MKNFVKYSVIFFGAVLMLTGCAEGGGSGENETESTASVSEDISTEESSPSEEITESITKENIRYMERVTAFKTSNSYGDRDMYGVKIIRSPEELDSFIESYGISDRKEQLTEFREDVDFDKDVIAADIVFLSSGGYDFDFYCTAVEKGEVIFDYELIENKNGMTDDEAALFMFARIPKELVS